MMLRRRIERVSERADEWRAMQLAREMAPELGRPVEELAAQMLQDYRDLYALVSAGLTLEEAVRQFAEDQNLDADAILAGMAKGAGQPQGAERPPR